MSAMGSASARGPEMWSDMYGPRAGLRRLLRGHVEQRPHRGELQRLGGLGVVEDLLEGLVHPGGLPDLFHRAAVVPGVATGAHLGTADELLHRLERRQSVVTLDVPEDGIEQLQRLRREVL